MLAGAAAGAAGAANDTVTVIANNTPYTAPGNNYFPDLGSAWTDAEFNIFGDGKGAALDLNSGTTIVIRTSVDNGTSDAPSWSEGSTTEESNNLTLIPPPCPIVGYSAANQLPAIEFTESNSASATSKCACPGAWDPISQTCWAPPKAPSDCTVIQECSGAVDGVCYDGLSLNKYDTGTRYLLRSDDPNGNYLPVGGLADTNPVYGKVSYYKICDDNPGYPQACSSPIKYEPVQVSCPGSGGGPGAVPGCYVNGIPVRCPRCGSGVNCQIQ